MTADPLASRNGGPAKRRVLSFVETVTKAGSPSFVPVPERIATFDNDGTLRCEQPVPVQVYFARDRVRALASETDTPMLEPLAHPRANSFKSFIVSGGGIEFLRRWAERVGGVPPEQVIGSSIETRCEPDATMRRRSEADNLRLLGVFPKGFALEATHRPHIYVGCSRA
jgi:hypothetical protein